MNLKYVFIISIIFVLWCCANCQAQNLTENDGFEGPVRIAMPPPGWNNCNDGTSSVDTQPGFFNNYAPASEGQTYISMVTRQMNPPGTVETAWAQLLTPFQKNVSYEFTIDLSLSWDFYGSMNGIHYFNNPCVFQIIGFNGDCGMPYESELLWQSDVLDNYHWQTFTVQIQPLTATFEKIALRPFFFPASNFKNSVVFVDNIIHSPPPEPDDEYRFFIPNVFSPNDDGENDLFFVRGEDIEYADIRIFDRWGGKVFHTKNIHEPWNGEKHSKKCETGVYAYIVTLTFTDGKTIVKHGMLTLVR